MRFLRTDQPLFFMNAKTKLFFITMAFYPIGHVNAQSKTESASPMPRGKWEIAIDGLQIIDKQKEAVGMMLRKYYANNAKAWRFKGAPHLVILDDNYVNQAGIKLSIGHEWRKRRFERFTWYYGTDVLVDYRFAQLPASGRTTNISYVCSGLTGGQFFIGKHLSISIESALRLRFNYENLNGSKVGKGSTDGSLQPLQAIFVGYHF
jgi:hypothetical protein